MAKFCTDVPVHMLLQKLRRLLSQSKPALYEETCRTMLTNVLTSSSLGPRARKCDQTDTHTHTNTTTFAIVCSKSKYIKNQMLSPFRIKPVYFSRVYYSELGSTPE